MNEINLYREATRNIFTPEEKSLINDSPAQSKILLMKAVNAIAKENKQIKKDYGIEENITKALPQRTPKDNRKEFSNILNRLLKGDYRTPEEFEALKQQKKKYTESKAQAEAELAKQKKKAKDLSDTYKGMKTNLYSAEDETRAGIASSNPIQ